MTLSAVVVMVEATEVKLSQLLSTLAGHIVEEAATDLKPSMSLSLIQQL